MFGAYRFILAILVALSHFGFKAGGFNPGQWSVISFYALSGLLMERQFLKLSINGRGTVTFYVDRFLRIWPLYFVVLLFAWASNKGTASELMTNATLLPLNYGCFTKLPTLVATSWSLACEVHFYLLVPMLVSASTRTIRFLSCASVGIFLLSPFLVYSDFWAYVGLPGMLFVFLSGILINRKDYVFLKAMVSTLAFFLIVFSAIKYFHKSLPTGININVIIGYIIAVVLIPILNRFSSTLKWDKICGLFSYPIFLCHMPVAAFLYQLGQGSSLAELLIASIIFSAGLILVIEVPFDRIRYRVRTNLQNGSRASSEDLV